MIALEVVKRTAPRNVDLTSGGESAKEIMLAIYGRRFEED